MPRSRWASPRPRVGRGHPGTVRGGWLPKAMLGLACARQSESTGSAVARAKAHASLGLPEDLRTTEALRRGDAKT
eukprot:11603431-Alexandrium_andersonii.AAC.1